MSQDQFSDPLSLALSNFRHGRTQNNRRVAIDFEKAKPSRWVSERVALLVIVAAASYQIFLAGIHKSISPLPEAATASLDAAIVLVATGLAFKVKPVPVLIAILVIAINAAIISAVSGELNAKAIRDLLVPVAFLTLGLSVSSDRVGEAAFCVIATLAVSVGIFEWLATDQFLSLVDPQGYNLARGQLSPEEAQWLPENSVGNGHRWGDRYFFPFLGPQRVGSIYLEPVSFSNFGLLALMWAGSRWLAGRQKAAIFALGVALFAITASDSRFGFYASGAILLLFATPTAFLKLATPFFPAVFIAIILLYAATYPGPVTDDLPGRIYGSGQLLSNITLPELFGLQLGQDFYDAGYYYAFSAFGLVLCIVFWGAFTVVPATSSAAIFTKAAFVFFLCTLLCISGTSPFALKFAALAWFLVGVSLRSSPKIAPPLLDRKGERYATAL